MMIAAMSWGWASFLKMRSMLAMESSSLTPCSSQGARARKMPPGIRPMPAEYGTTLPVRPRVIMVRPWYAPVKAITPARPVAARAILTAFSTASEPEVTSRVFFGKSPGTRLAISSASSM